jgi:hypothetical protein
LNPRILVCTPYRATTHPALLLRWRTHAQTLANVWPCISSLALIDTVGSLPKDERFAAHARARNALLDAIDLGAYDYLYWIDIDIIQWPDGLIAWALAHNPDGVTAPSVVLDRYVDRFYDTWGYLEHGVPARLYPPWFDQAGPLIELDSVGSCYMLPATVYRDGARYHDHAGATEHLSVMQACRDAGRRVVANLELIAVHAYLPEFGEALH